MSDKPPLVDSPSLVSGPLSTHSFVPRAPRVFAGAHQQSTMRILSLNAGSSSMKVALYQLDQGSSTPRLIASQNLPAKDDPVLTLQRYVDHADDENPIQPPPAASASSGEATAPDAPSSSTPFHPPVRLVVHRIVHGGSLFHHPTILTPEVIQQIESLNSLAPLHNPPALKWIAAARTAFPDATNTDVNNGDDSSSDPIGAQHVAIFDTSFFHELPIVSREYALPRELVQKHGLRRYGFHGIAHQAMCNVMGEKSRLKEAHGGRLITMQLGSGCSIAAISSGHPLDTSMGHTPLEGLVMSTRCGDLDPALVTFLQCHEEGLQSPSAMEDMLYHKSGLTGLSGHSGDMKTLQSNASSNPDAKLACDVFMHRLVKYVGSYVAVLGGLDTLVFGGGIGEHGTGVRHQLVEQLSSFLPIELDEEANKNAKHTMRISTDASKIEVWVIAVDEGEVMVQDALKLMQQQTQ